MEQTIDVLRLVDGSEIVTQRKDYIGKTEYLHMLRIFVRPDGQASMMPYIDISSFDTPVEIKTEHIILSYEAQGSLLEQYKKLVEVIRASKTGIVLPPKGIVR